MNLLLICNRDDYINHFIFSIVSVVQLIYNLRPQLTGMLRRVRYLLITAIIERIIAQPED